MRPPPLRPEVRLLDLREEDLRALLLRLAEDFRAPPPRRDDFRAPPRLRPEDPDRDRFLPPLERLDFLAAAMGKLRERGFVERIARFAHNNAARLSHRCNHVTQRRTIVIQLCASHRVAKSRGDCRRDPLPAIGRAFALAARPSARRSA